VKIYGWVVLCSEVFIWTFHRPSFPLWLFAFPIPMNYRRCVVSLYSDEYRPDRQLDQIGVACAAKNRKNAATNSDAKFGLSSEVVRTNRPQVTKKVLEELED
jgi:hypothetical protein